MIASRVYGSQADVDAREWPATFVSMSVNCPDERGDR